MKGCEMLNLKKPLLLFIIFVAVLLVAIFLYNKYCESKPEGCKKEKLEEREDSTREGIDW